MEYMDFVVQKLKEGCTCAAYNGQELLLSHKRGVAPLLDWLEKGVILADYTIADKVIGKGAAFLYLLLGARKLHAQVISIPALELLRDHGVEITYDRSVPAICNRDNTGFCPIETAVLDCVDPQKALILIKEELNYLNNK